MRHVILLLSLVLLCAAPAFAQSNPPVAACGLPAAGDIRLDVTYTLSADCTQTDLLSIANRIPKITVTVNGGGHTITGGAFPIFFGRGVILNLNSVTIDGANVETPSVIEVGTISASNVSFIRARGVALAADQSTLSNVLFGWNQHSSLALGGNGTAMHVRPNSSHSLSNVVFRNNFGSGGAVTVYSDATVTTNDCLTLSGNAPYDIYVHTGGAWTDNSTGACTGTIGNGAQAAIPAPGLMACGFPEAGNLDVSATYILNADCELSGRYYISENVQIRVVGNGRTISTTRSGYSIYTAATSSLRLDNVALEGIRFFHWGALVADSVTLSDTVDGILFNMGEARFNNAVFEDNSSSVATGRSVAIAYNIYQNGDISFTDTTFRNNSGGRGVLATFGATIELNGCITFDGNSPVDTYIYPGSDGVVTDNRDDCADPIVDPVVPPPPEPEVVTLQTVVNPPIPVPVVCNPHCDEVEEPSLPWEECGLRLGALGVICRPRGQPPAAHVWRIRPNQKGQHLPATGTYLFGTSQPQVEAVASGIVACSDDGRAAVRVGLTDELRQIFSLDPSYREQLKIPRRYIIVSKGPTAEGKVHHVVLDNSLDGHVFGTVDTFGGAPGQDCVPVPRSRLAAKPSAAPAAVNQLAPFARPQPSQPDGSIIHVVEAGDTTSAIAIAYRVSLQDIIALNQLTGTGDLITVGQHLIIRAALK